MFLDNENAQEFSRLFVTQSAFLIEQTGNLFHSNWLTLLKRKILTFISLFLLLAFFLNSKNLQINCFNWHTQKEIKLLCLMTEAVIKTTVFAAVIMWKLQQRNNSLWSIHFTVPRKRNTNYKNRKKQHEKM